MMTETEAFSLGERIAGDLPLAEEVSLVRDEWTGGYAVYVKVHGHEALIPEPHEWPARVLATWLAEDPAWHKETP